MPEFTRRGFIKPIKYATEEETLKFVNDFREAGGANLLEGLMPSIVSNPEFCLLAKGLNFGGTVAPEASYDSNSGEYALWGITIYDADLAQEIADTLGLQANINSLMDYGVIFLPRLIGNVAAAFDYADEGWVTKYRA